MPSEKRKFLIVTPDKDLQNKLKTWIELHITDSQCLFAEDGSEAISKIQNDPPHVVLASIELAKTNGYKLTQWVIHTGERTGVVLLTPVPNKERFVDEVVTSQVQFLDLSKGELEVQKVLLKAMNYVFHPTSEAEFHTLHITDGYQLIEEGEKADYVYLVKKGELVASTQTDHGKVVLGKIYPGEFVGEMAYINGERRTADVHACETCELIVVPNDVLDQVLFTKPAWSKALMKTLTKRLKTANKKVA